MKLGRHFALTPHARPEGATSLQREKQPSGSIAIAAGHAGVTTVNPDT